MNFTRLEATVDGKTAHVYFPSDTTLVTAKEIIFQYQKHIGMIEDQVREAEEKKGKEEEVEEEEIMIINEE